MRLSVDSPTELWDRPLVIAISGLAPRERARLDAHAVDYAGTPWQSSIAVRADEAGRVELRGNAAMRVLWSLHPPGAGPADYYLYGPPHHVARIRLELLTAGRTRATTAITRRLRAHGEREQQLRPAKTGFYGELFEPARTQKPHPGLLLFGGSEGGLSVTAEAELLAAHGYPTLALAYFAEPGLPPDLVRIPLEYFAHALRWLARQPGVDGGRLVVIGASRGSEAAQLLGVHYPRLVAGVVALVPSNAVVCGIPRFVGRPVGCIGAAWTFRGKAIPYTTFASPDATARIPDERISAPVFLDCGGEDALWPSCPMAHAIVTRLREHRFRHAVTLLEYPDAGHGVGALLPYEPARFATGGTVDADQRARADAWPRLLGFLRSLR